MAARRPLIEGLKPTTPPTLSQAEQDFLYQTPSPATPSPAPAPTPSSSSPAPQVSRVPISTRIRSDYSAALKRASLERQLKQISPSTLQDILEQALEPWLNSNGYLD